MQSATREANEHYNEYLTGLAARVKPKRRQAKNVVFKAMLLQRVLRITKNSIVKDVSEQIGKQFQLTKVADKLRKEGVDSIKKKMRGPRNVARAKTVAGISFDNYERFMKWLLPGERAVKAGRQTTINYRQCGRGHDGQSQSANCDRRGRRTHYKKKDYPQCCLLSRYANLDYPGFVRTVSTGSESYLIGPRHSSPKSLKPFTYTTAISNESRYQ
jgi:hypothetical protein